MKLLTLTAAKGNYTITSNGRKSMDISVAEVFDILLYYSSNEQPLKLSAKADEGDKIELLLDSAHSALYVNGKLCDEEWGYGEIALDDLTCDGLKLEIGETHRKFELPQRKGLTAEEIRLDGVNIGDCMPFSELDTDGRYHLFWLYDRHHHRSKWGKGAHQWAHASTADLVHWDEHPMAVTITEQFEGSICTGSTIRDGNKYYAWYAVRMTDGSPARITSAVSYDGGNYVKTGKYFTLPERYHQASARDPKIIKFEGRYHMLITTSLLSNGSGCLAHLVSNHADMSEFTDLGTIYETGAGWQPECADYFEMGGYYYLVWSGNYAYSKKPFGEGGWTIPENNHLDCGVVPKSAVCPWNGERVFAGFIPENGYAGRLLLKKAVSHSNGRLELFDIG